MSVFSTHLCDQNSPLLPLSPSLWFTTTPFTLLCVNKYCKLVCMYTMCRGGLLETIFCRSFTLCFWPDSEPTKLLDHPKQKPSRGGGLRQINTCLKVPLQVNFLRWQHFALPSMSLIFLCIQAIFPLMYSFIVWTLMSRFWLGLVTQWNKTAQRKSPGVWTPPPPPCRFSGLNFTPTFLLRRRLVDEKSKLYEKRFQTNDQASD
jgi:hypothetical protein